MNAFYIIEIAFIGGIKQCIVFLGHPVYYLIFCIVLIQFINPTAFRASFGVKIHRFLRITLSFKQCPVLISENSNYLIQCET